MRAVRRPESSEAETLFVPEPSIFSRGASPKPKPWRSLGLLALLFLGGVIWMVSSFRGARGSNNPAAEGAPTAAPLEASSGKVISEGRLITRAGAEVTVGTETGGTLLTLRLREGAHVQRGDTLAVFADSEERASLAEAKARLREARAELRYQEAELGRHRALQRGGAETASTLDRARRDTEAAAAREAVALATVDRLAARISKMRVLAPMSGTVIARFAEEGETLVPGAKLVTIADLTSLRIEAEVDEYDVPKVHLGADVLVRAEGFGATEWHGRVEELPASVTTRRLKPADTSRPSDIRVLLVKIALTEPTGLKLGQRAEVEISEGHSLIVPVR